MLLLIIKLILTPVLMGLVTLAGRRFGPAASGLLASLPLGSGPVSALIVWQEGVAFGHTAALGVLMGLVPCAAFLFGYSRTVDRARWPMALAAALGLYLVVAALSLLIHPTAPQVVAIALAALLAVILLTERAPAELPPPPAPSRWDLPLRCLLATAVVVGITGFAPVLGPHLSGLLSPIPVVTALIAVFTQRSAGPAATQVTLRAVMAGIFSFWAFFTVLAATLGPWPPVLAYAAAVLAALAFQGARMLLARRRPSAVPGVA